MLRIIVLICLLAYFCWGQAQIGYSFNRYRDSRNNKCMSVPGELECHSVKLHDGGICDVSKQVKSELRFKSLDDWLGKKAKKNNIDGGWAVLPSNITVWQNLSSIPYENHRFVISGDRCLRAFTLKDLNRKLTQDSVSAKDIEKYINALLLRTRASVSYDSLKSFLEIYEHRIQLKKSKEKHMKSRFLSSEVDALELDSARGMNLFELIKRTGLVDSEVGKRIRPVHYYNKTAIEKYKDRFVVNPMDGSIVINKIIWVGGFYLNSIGIRYKVSKESVVTVEFIDVLLYSSLLNPAEFDLLLNYYGD